jgi:hypothetical protein
MTRRTPSKTRTWLLVALAISLASGALHTFGHATAKAQGTPTDGAKPAKASTEKVAGEVLVILAKEADGELDPTLSSIKALQEPPFNAFKSMKILSRSGLSLDAKQPVEVELPNGRRLRLEWLERQPDGRFKVQVSINRPSQKDYLPLLQVIASPGEPFFVAGQKHEGGTLVIGVRVGDKPAEKAAKK